MTSSSPAVTELDVAAVRASFPSLSSGIAYFDGPGGTQTPRAVGAAIADTITGPLSNRGSMVASQRNSAAVVTAFRAAYADLLGADPRGVVYGRSATQLTYDFARHLAKRWQPGDEIVLSRLDHDANVAPWLQVAEQRGLGVRWLDFDPSTGEVMLDQLSTVITDRTRLLAITAASNLIGTRPPIRVIADAVHAVGGLIYVDAVHGAAHRIVDLAALGADLLVCSPYKFFGPHCGVLVADPALLEELVPDKLRPSTDQVPERFEFGTLPYETMAGATAAVDFLAALGDPRAGSRRAELISAGASIHAHESGLSRMIEDGLHDLPAPVTLHSRAAERTPTLLVTIEGQRMQAASAFLAEQDVLAPAGTFYAYEAARRLDLDDPEPLRIGVAAYTDTTDVDRLLTGLHTFVARTTTI